MLGRGSRSGRALALLQLAPAACTHCSLLLSHALHPHLPARAGRVVAQAESMESPCVIKVVGVTCFLLTHSTKLYILLLILLHT